MIVVAPGKVLVTGAYAVLDGARALVVAVDRLAIATESGVDTSSMYDGAHKLGLGSSAAFTVARLGREAAMRGDDLAREDVRARLFAEARAEHARAQDGGSGVDVAAAVYGGVLAYAVSSGARALRVPSELVLRVFWSGTSARTSDMRARVDAFEVRDPDAYAACIAKIARASDDAIASVERDDTASLVAAARATGEALYDLGRSADAPIVPPSFAELARAAAAEDAAFLPSGAGGGDVGVFLGLRAPSTNFLQLAENLKMTPLAASIDRGGVRRRD